MPSTCSLQLEPELHPDQLDPELLFRLLGETLEIDPTTIQGATLLRYSFDARKRHMKWNSEWSVALEGDPVEEEAELGLALPNSAPTEEAPHVVIIGSGPAGLFCALDLARGGARVTLCERGKDVQERRKDLALLNRGEEAAPDSNYCFGEGGAGTYSDGKLYTRSGDKTAIEGILRELVALGAPENILAHWRPHIGSNLLPKVIAEFRRQLESAGVEFQFNTRVEELLTRGDSVCGVRTNHGEITADSVVLATGHSALDSLQMAQRAGAQVAAKGFAMGVRIEHPQQWLNNIQYHGKGQEANLPAAFYELSSQVDERGVYSFCMCPGGWVVPSQAATGKLVVNGMSLSKRDSPFANSGIVVGLEPRDWCGKRGWRWGWHEVLKKAAAVSEDPMLKEVIEDPRGGASIPVAEGRLPIHPDLDPFFGVRIQHALEVLAAHAGGGQHKAPAQSCANFLQGHGRVGEPKESSYLPGLTSADFHEILPKGIARRIAAGLEQFSEQLPGYGDEFGQLIGVETRTSSPVRVLREENTLEAAGLSNLFPCGEGSGYAGGIMSAALDGKRVAQAILKD